MSWTDDQAHDEFARLRLLASLKYDGYRDFEAGVRFIESLASWLQQFQPDERDTAYQFVTDRLVYIGPGEMKKLVEQFYPNWFRPELIRVVAEEFNIRPYMINADVDALSRIDDLCRRTLILGLSDGARVDHLRHQNVGRIVNEQVVGSAQLDSEKWRDLLDNLQKDTGDAEARFQMVYLIDDFIATGTTFFRFDDQGKPKGKLVKFAKSVESAANDLGSAIFESSCRVNVHHHVGTFAAVKGLTDRLPGAQDLLSTFGVGSTVTLTCGITLPATLPLSLDRPDDQAFLELTSRYYDASLETVHTRVGGTDDMRLGYGGCALPLILDHNTPNNSVPLLWAETTGGLTDGGSQHAMRPLFRRRQRHV